MSDRPNRVLIIDDNPDDRALYRRRIAKGREQDYLFWETDSGEDGLQIYRAVSPDCILLDYQLPDLDGLEFIDRFQAEIGEATVAIIMLTGHGNEAVAVKAMKKGIHDYLVKDFALNNLRQVVQAAIDKGILRREIQEQRRQVESMTAERVQMIDELTRKSAALAEANQRKDEFLAMLAHELRNPLAPIRNAVQIMRMVGLPDPNLERSREMIERQVHHLTRLVDDLLEVSRITSGKIKIQKERVDMATVIARAVETSQPLIDTRHQKLQVSLAPEALLVEGDATRLGQVLANILNNAAKYTPERGSIWLTARCEGEQAVVRVRDEGIGIPAELLPRIFDLFTQADRSLDRSQGGLGIGLSLAKKLVEMHGGSVTAHSNGVDRGSEFVVRLPLMRAINEQSSSEPPQVAGAGVTSPCRVLVVDDNQDSADSIAMLLKLWGHHVIEVYDGAAVLEAARNFEPNVVLLDIGLPGLCGYDVARQLRKEFKNRRMLIVAMTGYGQEEDHRRSEEAGFDNHLTKPVDLEALQQVLANYSCVE